MANSLRCQAALSIKLQEMLRSLAAEMAASLWVIPRPSLEEKQIPRLAKEHSLVGASWPFPTTRIVTTITSLMEWTLQSRVGRPILPMANSPPSLGATGIPRLAQIVLPRAIAPEPFK